MNRWLKLVRVVVPLLRVSQSPAALGRAVAIGFLPVALVNVWFVTAVATQVSSGERLLHHAYDAGQLVVLGALAGAVTYALARLPPRLRPAISLAVLSLSCLGLLWGDLESFVERHADSALPYRAAFALAAACTVLACLLFGSLLSETRYALLALLCGLGLAVINHLVLVLDYPGTHFVIASCAAACMGPALLSRLERLVRPRTLSIALATLCVVSLPTVLLKPGPVVRSALVRSSGAVAAPFVSRAWRALDTKHKKKAPKKHASAWWKARTHASPVAPTIFEGRVAQPIVLLLTIDAVRGDLVEQPKWKRRLPNLSVLRRLSLRFERAWAAAPSTRPGLASLFLGTYFSQQRWNRFGKGDRGPHGPARLPDHAQGPHLATLLSQHGVQTVHLLTHGSLAPGEGIAEGFKTVVELSSYAPSEEVVDAVLKRLREHPEGPQLIYAHILDPHAPYNRGKSRGPQKHRYLGELAVVDRALGTLLKGLKKLDIDDRLHVIVASDHGEAFYEHGYRFHARTVYEEMIRIPLYIRGPSVKPRKVKDAASLIDLPPTILDLFGAPTPGHFMGQSLVPLFEHGAPKLARPLAVDSERGPRAMLFRRRYKAMEHIHEGTEEVYDLKKDPKERKNLAGTKKGQALIADLREFFSIHSLSK